MIQTNIQWEITDLFCGEANYSWIKRGTITTKPGEEFTDNAAIRRVKKEIGWNNVRCNAVKNFDSIILYHCGINQVCFITFYEFGRAS